MTGVDAGQPHTRFGYPFKDLEIARRQLADGAMVACPASAEFRATLIRIKAVEREIGTLTVVIKETVNGAGTF